MASIKRLGAITLAAVLCAAVFVPAIGASDITVGDFVQRLAKSKGLISSDVRLATDSLRGIGVRIPAEMNFTKRLTEGDVAAIAQAAGMNVRTSNPENAFSSEQVDLFLVSFGDEFGGGAGYDTASHDNPGQGSGPGNGNGGPPFDPFTKGKHGKGKGKGVFTPTDPE